MSRRLVALADAEPRLAEAWVLGKIAYEAAHENRSLILTCVHRTVEEQRELYASGRTKPGTIVTYVDGTTKKSQHNYVPSRALDFAVLVGGKAVWAMEEYQNAATHFKSHGLVWGGDWPRFKDACHLELPLDSSGGM